MPSLKSFSAAEEEEDQRCRNSLGDQFKLDADEEQKDFKENDEDEDNMNGEEEDKDSKERSSSEEQSESMDIELGDIRRDVQCPICLGIIRKARTVMECLHRFCRACIDKSMRLGNNECPACRKHCASRRSLRDDPNFDALIAALFRNIDRYEEEELAFHEEEKARNKQIQVSIAQVSQRQSEALVRRKSFGKEATVLSRSQRVGNGTRRRRNYRNMEHDDDDDDNDRSKDSSSDEHYTEIQQRKRKKRSTNHSTPHPSSSNANNIEICEDNETEMYRDGRGISPPGLVWNSEILAWGKGGTRSSTRHGNSPGASSKSVRNARLNRLVEYLGSLEGNSVELDVHLKLISLDKKCVPNLQQPYLCCRPTLLVKQLREYVALQTQLKAEEVELLVSKGDDKTIEKRHMLMTSSTDEMQSLEDDETMGKLKDDCNSIHEYMTVVYRRMQIG